MGFNSQVPALFK